MDIKKYMKALPALAALLITASCDNEDNGIVEEQPAQARIIHFEASVNNGNSTRATLSGSEYNLQSDDKLYVWGTNISGELTMKNYWGGTSCDFAGNLTYTGEGDPGKIKLNAVVKGSNDLILGTFDEFKARGFVPSYTTGLASDITEAVEKFSHLLSSNIECDFSEANPYCSFGPSQESAFISFDITLDDGTGEGSEIEVTINNGGSAVRSGNVTTDKVGSNIKATFVAAFPGGTTLSGATVTLGTRDAINFASSNPDLLGNNNYTVTKTYGNYKMTVSAEIGEEHKETSSTFKALPHVYNKTIEEIVKTLSGMEVTISSCTYKSGNDIMTITNTGTTHTLKANAKGSGVYTVSGTMFSFPFTQDVTFTVANNTDA